VTPAAATPDAAAPGDAPAERPARRSRRRTAAPAEPEAAAAAPEAAAAVVEPPAPAVEPEPATRPAPLFVEPAGGARAETPARRPRRAATRPVGAPTDPFAVVTPPPAPAAAEPDAENPEDLEDIDAEVEDAAREARDAAAGRGSGGSSLLDNDEIEALTEVRSRRRRTRRPDADVVEPEADDAEGAEGADEGPDTDDTDDTDDAEGTGGGRRRRRRRGRRRGGRPNGEGTEDRDADEAEESEDATTEADEEGAEDNGDADEGGDAGSRRRRRRRRRSGGGSDDAAEPGPDDPPNTVVRVREPRSRDDEVRGISGSTRMEAKRQRRRDGRDGARRKPPVLTEAEFLARRESVERVMVIRERGDRTQIGVLEDGVLVEHFVTRASTASYSGNVYLGRVQNVLPSMEAAFIDIGKGRNAVLYAGEVDYDASALEGRPRTIEAALKSGQPVMVQVTKDPMGHKGARLTGQVSLPGRYVVYVPGGGSAGISRKLPDTERTRLKAILKKIVPDEAGVIVRTAAEGASEEELTRDIERLQGQWEEIQRKAAKATAPALLSAEPDLVVKVVRDIFNEDVAQLVVSGARAWETITEYVDSVAPDLRERVTKWTAEGDVFAAYRIDEQLAKALDRKVWLPSGGSLVIDRTEAMTVVDVNTGKFVGKGGNLEETVTKNNLEAAEEIVRQLRLRDIGGIVVVDFIDMVLESNRDLVLRRLTECLGRDRTKHQVAEVTSLGLVQMTRKRVGTGLLEAFSEPCEHCHGRGVLLHLDAAMSGTPLPAPQPVPVPRPVPASGIPAGLAAVAAASRPKAADGSDEVEPAGGSDGQPGADLQSDDEAAPAAPKRRRRGGRGGAAAKAEAAAADGVRVSDGLVQAEGDQPAVPAVGDVTGDGDAAGPRPVVASVGGDDADPEADEADVAEQATELDEVGGADELPGVPPATGDAPIEEADEADRAEQATDIDAVGGLAEVPTGDGPAEVPVAEADEGDRAEQAAEVPVGDADDERGGDGAGHPGVDVPDLPDVPEEPRAAADTVDTAAGVPAES
jgi:ribonuclease E